jgi:hypothetical protein
MSDDANSSLTNGDLNELHDLLVGKVAALSAAIGKAQDTATVIALVGEISEVNHRVTLVGNLLFTQQTKGIAAAMGHVRDAEADVNKAIKKIDNVAKLLKTLSGFLTLVDKVIDTAKLVGL